jgi:hypothetical protein
MLTRRLARAACALAMVAGLVALTGCGDSKNSSTGSVASYKAGFAKVSNDLKNASQAASAKVVTSPAVADKVAGLDELRSVFSKAADDFAALSPPANLKADNDELVTELHNFSNRVNDIVQAYKAGDSTKAVNAFAQLQALRAKAETTIGRIQAKLGG